MPLTTHTCLTIACDICQAPYLPDDYTPHFATVAEASESVRGTGWTVTAHGCVLCDEDDAAHRAALAALLPPEPVLQVPGQLGLDGTEEPLR